MPRPASSSAGSRRTVPAEAASLLGPDHPLSQAIDRLNAVRRQAATTVTAALCALVALLSDVPWAEVVLGAATAVAVALWLVATLQRQVRDERARDLVIEGRHELPLPEVARVVRSLSSERHRERLANALERALVDAERWPVAAGVVWPAWASCDLRNVAEVIRDIVAEVRKDGADLRGVAVLDRLLAGQSPSAQDPEGLREELGRIRCLLRMSDRG